MKTVYDSIVVGAGPNGLAAAITLQKAGLSVLLIEAKDIIGGGLCSAELTLPGFIHDVCSSVHPLAAGSPFFKMLSLERHGLEFIQPSISAVHPFDDGAAAALHLSVDQTVSTFSDDKFVYSKLMNPLVKDWQYIAEDILGPFHFPKHLFKITSFGLKAFTSASHFSKRFHSKQARGLWAGMAAHSMQPFYNITTSSIGLVLMILAHVEGWPIPKGGANAIANALSDCFISLGGEIQTRFYVHSLNQLPSSRAIIFDVTPKQLLQIAGQQFSSFYKWQLKRYKYGMGIFKIDWALNEPIPFTANECRNAGTIHLGNTFEEIEASEKLVSQNKHPEKPFVLLTQPSLFDRSRAPSGKHLAWAYCHVPNGSTLDMTDRIERQVERFAPGFKDVILARHTMNTAQMETYNPNYVGGDINGGMMNVAQLFTRPALRSSPYRTSAKGIYICSSSTPPGGGVHGMCGYHAAKTVLKDIYKMDAVKLY